MVRRSFNRSSIVFIINVGYTKVNFKKNVLRKCSVSDCNILVKDNRTKVRIIDIFVRNSVI